MREDGSELDRIFITKTENFIPNDSLELPVITSYSIHYTKLYDRRVT